MTALVAAPGRAPSDDVLSHASQPDPGQSEARQPDPGQSDPGQSDPGQSDPVQSDPVQPEPEPFTREGMLSAVTAALSTVRDPELDESIVDLGFVTEISVHQGHVLVRLRLPTYFCAPNFAYLMVADAHDAVRMVIGVLGVAVILEDHFASAEINAGVAAGAGFVGSFGEEAAGELDELRLTFQRKAHTAGVERACRLLLRSGWTVQALSTARIQDLPASPELESLLRRRGDLGLICTANAPIFVDESGTPFPPADAALRLRFAQTVRVSIDGNAHFCRGLLTTRYPQAAAHQRPRQFAQEGPQ